LLGGNNICGQIGDNSMTNRVIPWPVTGITGKKVVQLAAGSSHSLALMSDGTVYAWGCNANGQLGDGSNTTRLAPVAVSGLIGKNVTQLVAGEIHSLALLLDGTVYAWGRNSDGQLGDGSTVDRLTPVAVPSLTGRKVVQIVAGSSFV
jgi:alpha-tubulin suppressor-like RCC1 family protein